MQSQILMFTVGCWNNRPWEIMHSANAISCYVLGLDLVNLSGEV